MSVEYVDLISNYKQLLRTMTPSFFFKCKSNFHFVVTTADKNVLFLTGPGQEWTIWRKTNISMCF